MSPTKRKSIIQPADEPPAKRVARASSKSQRAELDVKAESPDTKNATPSRRKSLRGVAQPAAKAEEEDVKEDIGEEGTSAKKRGAKRGRPQHSDVPKAESISPPVAGPSRPPLITLTPTKTYKKPKRSSSRRFAASTPASPDGSDDGPEEESPTKAVLRRRRGRAAAASSQSRQHSPSDDELLLRPGSPTSDIPAPRRSRRVSGHAPQVQEVEIPGKGRVKRIIGRDGRVMEDVERPRPAAKGKGKQVSASSTPASGKKRKRAADVSSPPEQDLEPEQDREEEVVQPKRRGRPKRVKEEAVSTPAVEQPLVEEEPVEDIQDEIEEVEQEEDEEPPRRKTPRSTASARPDDLPSPSKKAPTRAPVPEPEPAEADPSPRRSGRFKPSSDPFSAPSQPTTPSKKSKHAPTPSPSPSPPPSPSPQPSPSPELEIEQEDQAETEPSTLPSPPPPPASLPVPLPGEFQPFLAAQQRAILLSISRPSLIPSFRDGQVSTIKTAVEDGENVDEEEEKQDGLEKPVRELRELLLGTIERGEGNSCLVLGPRGVGKSRAVELALRGLARKDETQPQKLQPIIVRLSGLTHPDDKAAMSEMRRQILKALGEAPEKEAEGQRDGDGDDEDDDNAPNLSFASLPALSRPLIIILSSFDTFCLRPRQALLYVLLDAVQTLRAGEGAAGIAVIGMTSRIDCVGLMEKRVKSRFSHRIVRVVPPQSMESYIELARQLLLVPLQSASSGWEGAEEWMEMWEQSVESLLGQKEVVGMLRQTWELVQDVRLLQRIVTHAVVHLTTAAPWLTHKHIAAAISAQRGPATFPHLKDLPIPALALIVAAYHTSTAGHETFTFTQLEHAYRAFARDNSAMVNAHEQMPIPKEALLAAFDELVQTRIFTPASLPFAAAMREFTKYRCSVERADIAPAITKSAGTDIRRWLTKWAQA